MKLHSIYCPYCSTKNVLILATKNKVLFSRSKTCEHSKFVFNPFAKNAIIGDEKYIEYFERLLNENLCGNPFLETNASFEHYMRILYSDRIEFTLQDELVIHKKLLNVNPEFIFSAPIIKRKIKIGEKVCYVVLHYNQYCSKAFL